MNLRVTYKKWLYYRGNVQNEIYNKETWNLFLSKNGEKRFP